MKVSDFKAGELFAFESETTLWGGEVTLFVELNDDYDRLTTLSGYMDIINNRLEWLESNREAVIKALLSDITGERLGLTAEELSERLFPEEVCVYCDDGRDNVWTDVFVRLEEGSVQFTLSPENKLECKGICS